MHFDNTLLTTAQQTALTAALAGIPALLTPLAAQITAAQPFAAQVANYQAQMATMKDGVSGGGALPSSFSTLAQSVNLAEQTAFGISAALYAACQNCEPLVVQQLLPLAQAQAVVTIQNANTGLVPSGGSEFNAAPLGSTFVTGLGAFFRSCFGPHENSIVVVLAKATKLQTLLQAMENGTDFYSVS